MSFARIPPSGSIPTLQGMLLVGGRELIWRMFDSWSVDLIMQFSMLDFKISCISRFYASRVWNIPFVLAHWVEDVNRFLGILDETDSIVCGPTVTKFFRRELCTSGTLDICTGVEGFRRLKDLLDTEGYRAFRVIASKDTQHRVPVPLIYARTAVHQYNVTVDASIFEDMSDTRRFIAIHVVHGDPVEFLVTLSSSKSIQSYVLVVLFMA